MSAPQATPPPFSRGQTGPTWLNVASPISVMVVARPCQLMPGQWRCCSRIHCSTSSDTNVVACRDLGQSPTCISSCQPCCRVLLHLLQVYTAMVKSSRPAKEEDSKHVRHFVMRGHHMIRLTTDTLTCAASPCNVTTMSLLRLAAVAAGSSTQAASPVLPHVPHGSHGGTG